MFHFMLGPMSCCCDTAEQLLEISAAIVAKKPEQIDEPVWFGDAGNALDMLLAKKGLTKHGRQNPKLVENALKEVRDELKAKTKQRRWTVSCALIKDENKDDGPVNHPQPKRDLSKLPVLNGPVTWATTHKWAKKLGRTDITNLRSDLYQKQQAAKSAKKK
jgi:hypothetical protein